MILGVVEYAHDPEATGVPQWCRVRPIYKSENFNWVPVEDSESEFPSQGLVYWYGPPAEALKGTYWIGQTQRNPSAGEGKRRDTYYLEEGQQAYEFVDLRGDVDETDLRRLCAKGNFSFSHRPIGPILVKIPSEESDWVGPIELDYRQDMDGRFVGSHQGLGGFISIHEVSPESVQELMIEGARVRVLRPKETVGGKVSWFNAQDDNSLLQSALKRIRKVNRSTAEAMDITRSVFEAYVETLQSADLLGDQAVQEGAREGALRRLFERMEADFLARQDVAEALLSHESVQEKLASLIEKRVDDQKVEIAEQATTQQKELLTELEGAKSRLESLAADERRLKERITSHEELMSNQKEELERISRDLSKRLRKVVSEVVSHPVEQLGRHAVIQALVKAGGSGLERVRAKPSLSAAGELLGGLSDLGGALISGSNCLSIRHDPSFNMVASLLSGVVPIGVGSKARSCAQLVASLIAGNNVFEIVIPSNLYSVDDLMCLPATNPNTQSVTQLFEVIQQAESSSELVVLVFAGVNRAPLESAFENLIRDERQVFSSGHVIPFRGCANERVPRLARISQRVLMVGTLTNGPSTFRVPASIRLRMSIVDTDCPSDSDMSTKMPSGYRVSREAWQEWGESAQSSTLVSPTMDLSDFSTGLSSDTCAAEIKAFGAVYGETEFEQAVAAWMVARLAGVIDEGDLMSLAERCGQSVAKLVNEAVDSGQVGRIAEYVEEASL